MMKPFAGVNVAAVTPHGKRGDEPDIGALEPGQQVEVTWDARPDRLWTGKLESAPKQVVARGVRSVGEVLCSIDNDKLELLPNINVQVRILVRERHGVLVIPREAVHEDQTNHYVFVVAGDKLHRRQVSVGISSASKYEVVSGVEEGQRVALPGDRRSPIARLRKHRSLHYGFGSN